MRTRLISCAVLAAATIAPAAAQQADQQAIMFGARESVHAIDLSPDGTKLVFVQPAAGQSSVVMIADLATNRSAPILRSSGNPETVQRCDFVSNGRLVCRVSALLDYAGDLVGFSRLTSVNADGTDPKPLGQRESSDDGRLRQIDGGILDWLPGDGDAVLMARDYVPEINRTGSRIGRTRDGYAVDRIDVRTLKVTSIEPPAHGVSDFMSDGRGRVRIMEKPAVNGATGLLSGRSDYFYRRAGSSDWEKFASFESGSQEGMVPVAIDADLDSAYVLKKLNGRMALYRVKLDGTMAIELAYANDKVDVDNVVRVGKGARVIGVTFAEEERRIIYFDDEYKKLAAALSKAIPNLPLISFVGASADGSKLLLFAGSDADPGRYYLYDKGKRGLNELMLARPQLEHVAMATMKPVSYAAADGTMVPAYLSLPPGKDAKNLPAIVMPHGGPSARDEWGFDWLTQYLVSKGYAVLQPNYRGSAGFGDAWMAQNGFRGWRTSIGDITAGAKWLTAQGIADPGNIAIVGWSYGGYAALQSGVAEPGLYKRIVAIAPVTDLELLKQQADGFTHARLVRDFIGTGAHIKDGSPLQNVDRISVPVLMFHGTRDANVDVRQSQTMAAALQRAGKKSELIVFPDLDHSLVDSSARARMLEKIGSFLTAPSGS